MQIQDIMSKPAITCGIHDSLNTAARLMWEHDCGAIPIVDDDGRLAGIVTDRDICMATYTQGRAPQDIPVASVMTKDVRSCEPGDSLETAEGRMQEHQIRRLPVIDGGGQPIAFVSLNDITRAASRAESEARASIDHDVVDTLAAICAPRATPQVSAQAAE
jgi:CBS domain-containing protein